MMRGLDSKKREVQGYFRSKRTDKIFEVAVPRATALADVARKPLMLECATEFYNFI